MRNLYIHYVAKHATGMYAVVMDDSGLPFCVSLQPNDKFLADGVYKSKKRMYNKGGYMTFEVIVEGHTDVLYHKGNHQEDSKLCFLLGEQFETVEGRPGIAQSGHAFEEFWNKYKDVDEFDLHISRAMGLN